MDKFDILLWVMGGGMTLMMTLMLIIWNHMTTQFTHFRAEVTAQFAAMKSDVDGKFAAMKGDMDSKFAAAKADTSAQFADLRGEMNSKFADSKASIASLSNDVKDIDRRLCRLEGAFASKDCCMIKDSRHLEKAE